MRAKFFGSVATATLLFTLYAVDGNGQGLEKTTFQTGGVWKPTTDTRSDVAIVYGVSDRKEMTFEQRVQSWRDRGYTAAFMTGIAWGGYQEYFTGKWDGTPHFDEAQVEQTGDTIWHGHLTPYIVPTSHFLTYFKEKIIKRVIDAGIDAIYLEEPEFWARAGYSAAFKKEWKDYYGFDWHAPHESAENTYLANKLKYHLYYRALEDALTYAKTYGKSKGMNVRCYVATHSLINYSMWQIVSPEASLASLACVDGYIVQSWTGTAREPNYFNGTAKSRTFETAFLEYGCMRSMTVPTNRKLFFENDPVEDVRRDWSDYKKNYETTFAAELFYPDINNYEVMPWPDRIFDGQYYTSRTSNEKAPMPRSYSTQLLVMINSLNSMPVSDNKTSGTQGISVLMGNSMMFQQLPTHDNGKAFENPYFSNFYETSGMYHRYFTDTRLADPLLSNFYGEALPFLERGVPVNIVHLENVGYEKAFDDTRILLMSYSNMKPLTEKAHEQLAQWVRNGGIIVYSGRDDDPFQSVKEWWNSDGKHFGCPADDLFEKLGIGRAPKEGTYPVGKGSISIIRKDPKEYVLEAGGDKPLREKVEQLCKVEYKNNLYLRRGPYEIISVLDEGASAEPYVATGKLIDLFDPSLPVLSEKKVGPGEQAFLYHVPEGARPQVLASASRVYEEKVEKRSYAFVVKGPLNTTNVLRVLLPAEPRKVTVVDGKGKPITDVRTSWDGGSNTSFLSFENDPDGVKVRVEW